MDWDDFCNFRRVINSDMRITLFIICCLYSSHLWAQDCALVSVGAVVYPLCGDVTNSNSIALEDIDLSVIDWQNNTSGSWGAGATLVKPTEPTTSTSVTVSTPAEFETEAATDGQEITIDTSWADTNIVDIDASDIRVIIPDGITVGDIRIGESNIARSRIRIQGSTAGQHSGGQMGTLTVNSTSVTHTDVIVDGVDMVSGPSGGSDPHMNFRVPDVTRLAVLNVRAIASCYNWLGTGQQVLIAYSNFQSAATNDSIGCSGQWGYRGSGGPTAFFNVRWDANNLFATIRTQPTATPSDDDDVSYFQDSTFVNVANGRNQWVWQDIDAGDNFLGAGGIFDNVSIYVHAEDAGCNATRIGTTDVDYAEARDSTFYNGGYYDGTTTGITSSVLSSKFDTNTNNTVTTFTDLPEWTGPGDPTTLSLPSGITKVTNGTASCSFP